MSKGLAILKMILVACVQTAETVRLKIFIHEANEVDLLDSNLYPMLSRPLISISADFESRKNNKRKVVLPVETEINISHTL